MICVKMIQTLGERNRYGTVKKQAGTVKIRAGTVKKQPGTVKITGTLKLANRK